MKKKFSKKWKSSKQPRKQRKYRANAPLHIRKKFLSSNLSKNLREKHKIRNIFVRKGDKIKIVRGQFKKHIGNVSKIDLRKMKVYIEGAEILKKDGTKVQYPIDPSNLIIQELNLDDKKRKKIMERRLK